MKYFWNSALKYSIYAAMLLVRFLKDCSGTYLQYEEAISQTKTCLLVSIDHTLKT